MITHGTARNNQQIKGFIKQINVPCRARGRDENETAPHDAALWQWQLISIQTCWVRSTSYIPGRACQAAAHEWALPRVLIPPTADELSGEARTSILLRFLFFLLDLDGQLAGAPRGARGA